jgi:hypothetical protein
MWSLDERDRAVLLALLEHKVLTTGQIKILFFRSLRRCQHRLKELKDLGLIGSFTPRRNFGGGRPADCLFLTKLGSRECARELGVRASDLSWFPDENYRHSKNLAHRLGVNAFFCALVECSRTRDGHCLATWRPEHWVRTRAAEVKPDGFGRYLHPGGACEFYLEYDRGTEAFKALSTKINGYLRVAAGWTEEEYPLGFPNVLFVVPDEAREMEVGSVVRQAIRGLRVGRLALSVFPLYAASENRFSEHGVLGRVWRPLTADDDLLSLVDLPTQSRHLYKSPQCLGQYFTDADSWRRIAPASGPPRYAVQLPRLPP